MSDTKESNFDPFSKEHRWFAKELHDDDLPPASRRLLEDYAGIPSKDIDAHIFTQRDALWSSAPYPCIGNFRFLKLNLPSHPLYTHILYLLKPNTSSDSKEAKGPFILDLGCCVAQELRTLACVGIPTTNLYGSDRNPDFLTKSYDLFKDTETFKGTLVPADIFAPNLFEEAFVGWEGKFKVIHAGLFLHLFSWEKQLIVCERVIKLLEKEKGALFVGETAGNATPGERLEGNGKFKTNIYIHNGESFEKLWKEAAEKNGSAGKWKVVAKLRVRPEGKGKASYFQGDGAGLVTFSVERLSGVEDLKIEDLKVEDLKI